MQSEQVHLRCKQGSSDKEYHAHLEPLDGEWVVKTQWGRFGTTLSSQTKGPLPYAAAKKEYDRIKKDKLAGGYSPTASGVPFAGTPKDGRQSGVLPQLLNNVKGPEQLEALLRDPAWWVQEKHDGHRRLIEKTGTEVTGINRKGLTVPLPQPVADAFAALPGDFVVDGELVGSEFHPFDLIVDGVVYADRLDRLEMLCSGLPNLVITAQTEETKRALLADVTARRGEGIVLKRHDANYEAGKPNSGGNQLKWKLKATASCIVLGYKEGKDSIQLGVHNAGQVRSVGFTKVHANQEMPPEGSIVEVEYLYANPGGALQQPNLLGVRDDIEPEACTAAQLKLKASDEDEEA